MEERKSNPNHGAIENGLASAGPAPSKVLMTADAIGGVWTYAMELAAACASHGIEFIIATMGRHPNTAQLDQARALPNVRLATSAFRLEWMTDPWDDVDAAGRWLQGLVERESPDAIHLNGYAHGAVSFPAPILIVAHSCVYSWWQAVHRAQPPEADWRQYRARIRAGLSSADAIVAPTRAMLAELDRCYGPLPIQGTVIPNACQHHHGARDGRPFNFTPPKRPIIAAAGRLWDAAKNIQLLDAIAHTLPWPCEVAGESAAPESRAHAPSPAHNAALKLLGRLSAGEMADLYRRASIFVHPARYEPFGLAPLEAAHAGCALVLGDIPSLREVWDDAAIYIDPDDARGLRMALLRLIDDPALRHRMAAAAQRRAALYSLQRFGHAYARLYSSLLTPAAASEQAAAVSAVPQHS